MSFQLFPPALMIQSPRLTRAGSPSASVVGINTTPLADGAVVYCVENRLTYKLDKSSVVTADGNLVLAPLTGPGRWTVSIGSTSWTLNDEWVPAFQCFPFTAVVQTGAGPQIQPLGTPESVTPLNTVLNYQALINVGGAPGTATFDLSDDGGGTFFLTNQVIPASGLFTVPGRGYDIVFGDGVYVPATAYDYSTVYANLGDGRLVGNYRIVGDSAEIRLVFTPGPTTDFGGGVGTPTSTTILLPLPPGYSLDITKLPVAVTVGPADLRVIEAMIATQLVVAAFGATTSHGITILGIDRTVLSALPVSVPQTLLAVSVPLQQTP